MHQNLAVEVSNLAKTYKGSQKPAVNHISFQIEKGDFFGILGPNGAGKSTTISILCGLIKPDSGIVNILSRPLINSDNALRMKIGFVPQEIALFHSLSAFQNLRYFGNMFGLAGSELKNRIQKGLGDFGLQSFMHKPISSFSGGMMRRVNLLAGTLHRPELLFLDEPTVGVDIHSRVAIKDHLLELNMAGTTIVYTSHLMEEAEALCRKILVIDEGSVISNGKPPELLVENSCANLEQLFLKLTGKNLRD